MNFPFFLLWLGQLRISLQDWYSMCVDVSQRRPKLWCCFLISSRLQMQPGSVASTESSPGIEEPPGNSAGEWLFCLLARAPTHVQCRPSWVKCTHFANMACAHQAWGNMLTLQGHSHVIALLGFLVPAYQCWSRQKVRDGRSCCWFKHWLLTCLSKCKIKSSSKEGLKSLFFQ